MSEKIMMCIRENGQVLVGEGDLGQAAWNIIFKRPRVLGKEQQTGNIICLEMIGKPKSIPVFLKTDCLIYECHDEAIIKEYKESVTGLVLPKENVVKMN